MLVTQVHDIVNSITQEILGEIGIINEDLSNIVDVGKAVFGSDQVDNYVRKLVNKVGKVIFVNRVYSGGVPSLLMDSWEFGSVLEKLSTNLPDAVESDSWKLTDGSDYSPNVFHQPDVEAKFYNSKVCFEIPMSFTEMQVKESFTSAIQLNGFISMVVNAIETSMTIKIDGLISRTINNMIAETIIAELGSTPDVTIKSPKCVNLLALYNETVDESISQDQALTNRDFIRFSTYQMSVYTDRLAKVSTLFNVGGKARFTPISELTTVLLSDFSKASETFLLSNSFNSDKVTLPSHENVPFWQGSGTSYSFDDVSKIDVESSSGSVSFNGILGVMIDRESCGVSNLSRRVTTNYNPKAEFFNNFYKFDSGFYNDLNENFVVFYIADAPAP